MIGLAKTASLKSYLGSDSFTGLRHTPFSDEDIYYPFLICEAKSEQRGPGFAAIEAQTALPIRTCIKLQEDLKQRRSYPLTPFVWFLAYQGDEWRVAACIKHAEAYVSFFSMSLRLRKADERCHPSK